jgi:hypothetical protein
MEVWPTDVAIFVCVERRLQHSDVLLASERRPFRKTQPFHEEIYFQNKTGNFDVVKTNKDVASCGAQHKCFSGSLSTSSGEKEEHCGLGTILLTVILCSNKVFPWLRQIPLHSNDCLTKLVSFTSNIRLVHTSRSERKKKKQWMHVY